MRRNQKQPWAAWELPLQFFTKPECLQRLADLPGVGRAAGAQSAELQVTFENLYDRTAPLARLFLKLIGTEQPAFLWIHEFGIWSPLENWPLFETLRRADGELRPLYEAPGHMFAADEQEALMSYLQLIIIFGWGCILLGIENRHRLIVSHDSWASIRSLSDMPGLIKTVSDFGLSYLIKERPRDTLTALGLSRDGKLLSPQQP